MLPLAVALSCDNDETRQRKHPTCKRSGEYRNAIIQTTRSIHKRGEAPCQITPVQVGGLNTTTKTLSTYHTTRRVFTLAGGRNERRSSQLQVSEVRRAALAARSGHILLRTVRRERAGDRCAAWRSAMNVAPTPNNARVASRPRCPPKHHDQNRPPMERVEMESQEVKRLSNPSNPTNGGLGRGVEITHPSRARGRALEGHPPWTGWTVLCGWLG